MKKTTLFLFILTASIALGADFKGAKIYINPGHGGWNGANDRNMVVPPFTAGDSLGFWESKSNLDKGLFLQTILQNSNAKVMISRTLNREVDDRNLTEIAQEANAFGADFFISIHSNATGMGLGGNYPLMLFRGKDNDPGYPNNFPQNKDFSYKLWDKLVHNESSGISLIDPKIQIRGDVTFYAEAAGWSNGLGVLRPLTVPGMLSEGSFHDYIPETYRLLNLEYKHLEAWHIYLAFAEQFQAGTPPYGQIAGFAKDLFEKIETPALYRPLENTHDVNLPLHGATISLKTMTGTLLKTYQTDNYYNGFFMFDSIAVGQYIVTIEKGKYKTFTDTLTVEAGKTVYSKGLLSKNYAIKPEVSAVFPTVSQSDSIWASTHIEILFSMEMDTISLKEAFVITPATDGKISFDTNLKKLIFQPSDMLNGSTLYTVSLKNSAKNRGGNTLSDPCTFSFKTHSLNYLEIAAQHPQNLSYDLMTTSAEIQLQFISQPAINQKELISIVDDKGKNINFEITYNNSPLKGGSLNIKPQNITEGIPYELKIEKRLKDINGLTLSEPFHIFFQANGSPCNEGTVLEDFETNKSWDIATDLSLHIDQVSTRAGIYKTNKLFGTYSYRLFYKFTDQTGKAVLSVSTDKSISITKNHHIGLHIYGDLSGHNLSITVAQNSQTYTIPLTTLDFYGWKFVSIALENAPFEGAALIKSIELDKKSIYREGILLLDNLITAQQPLADKKTDSESTIKLYPNPAQSHITIEGEWNSCTLFDSQGRWIRTFGHTQDPISLQNLSNGIYFVKIKNVHSLETIQKLMINNQ